MAGSSSSVSVRANAPKFNQAQSSLNILWAILPPGLKQCPRSSHQIDYADGPDFAAMRERRQASEPRLRDLQRAKGVVSLRTSDSLHEQVLDAYGYGDVVQLSMAMGLKVSAWLSTLSFRLPDFSIGPRGCDAAPVTAMTPKTFTAKFSKDFHVWMSAAARKAGSMNGVLVVIGEHHYDSEISAMVRRVMLEFRRSRRDRYFQEGDSKLGCAQREDLYVMSHGDCRLMEQGSAAVARLSAAAAQCELRRKEAVDFILRHVPASRTEKKPVGLWAMQIFIDRFAHRVPDAISFLYDPLKEAIKSADQHNQDVADEERPGRDTDMANHAIQHRSPDAWNFLLAGSDHLKGLMQRLSHLPTIFLLPKALLQDYKDVIWPLDMHDEL